MGDVNLVALLVAILGSTGVGGVIATIINAVIQARKGVAVREQDRRTDIIKQRDEAIARAKDAEHAEDAADARADRERRERIRMEEAAARARLKLIQAGIEPDPWPDNKKE